MIVFFSIDIAHSQVLISGKLFDLERNPIPNVSVNYKKVGSTALIGFTRSATDGTFQLESKITDADSIHLEFNHLSYARYSVIVANKTGQYTYTLSLQAKEIQEVKAAKLPIFKRKDTINYNVDAFSSSQDRVIADIIRKLPGVEMEGDKILYQGKPIQKYMVNNLDLMEGRYAMINKNLPAEAVRNVQIVENDQPIKLLDSVMFSDQASLNLELKRFTSTGSGKIGIGASPGLWDLNVTPMTFGQNFQMLNSFQSNNVGVDVAKDLRAFYTGETGVYFTNKDVNISDGPSYIRLRDVPSPGFEERKWLDNKIFLFSTNVLHKLRNELEVKGNISYYDDTRRRSGFTATHVFTADETILNNEAVDNRYRINNLDLGATIEKNEKNIFFRNVLKYHKRWNSDLGMVLLNEETPIRQQGRFTDEVFKNSLVLGRFIGKQLFNINSSLEWRTTPQSLQVMPGQFEDLLNDGNPYDRVQQLAQFEAMDWKNNMSFTRKWKKWRVSPILSLDYNRNHLQTDIELDENGENRLLGHDFFNDMRNSQIRLGVDLGFGFETARWKLNLATPYSAYYFHVDQQGVRTLDNALRNTFNPRASATYIANANHQFSASAAGGNQFGGLNNFYNGFIIGEYRNIQRYDARLLGTKKVSTSVGYNYKNTLKANFAHVQYGFDAAVRDYIYETQVDSLGRLRTSIANRESQNQQHRLSGGLSHFFASAKTVVKINGRTNWSSSDYFLNNVMARQKTFHYAADLEIMNNASSLIAGEYKTSIGQTVNTFAAGRSNTIFYNNHYLTVLIYPTELQTIILSNSYYHNNISGQPDQYFIDATYRVTMGKRKIDVELIAQNLLNNNEYVQQIITDYQLIQSRFELRPRQFIVSTKFRF
ncbi:TonB-dependent receptor [Sphingobacterium chungjuense]|uniref:TonB-dependent receptor n=1 Tax=Sphingobacterium chungjuense TaxID=2675553 RepID=UPI001408A613|nr:TonB-dependent receptor [Sphingobacterium chungjuense]